MLSLIDVYRKIPLIICLIALMISGWLYLNKNVTKVVVIAITDNETKILTDHKAKISEKINFIRLWVSYYYNYDNLNLFKQLDEGVKYLSPRLWKDQEAVKFKKLLEMSKKHNISEKTLIKSIDYDEDKNLWLVSVLSEFTKNGHILKNEANISLRIIDVERSEEDKWGLQIDELNNSI